MNFKLIHSKPDPDLVSTINDLSKYAEEGEIDGIVSIVTRKDGGRYYVLAGKLYDNVTLAAGYTVHLQHILGNLMDEEGI